MRVWEDKAYMFVGTTQIYIFDLEKEIWSSMQTSLPGKKWPYSRMKFQSFSTAILDGKLYVFGGDDGDVALGMNVLMALDLKKKVWDHISGTSDHKPQIYEPNLRMLCGFFAVPELKKLYVLYGTANRTAASDRRQPGGGLHDYTYDDFWTFDLVTRKWQRERLRGNFPSPRTEFSYAYIPSMKRVIVYGGYHGSLTTVDTGPGVIGTGPTQFPFSYFGDTFIYDPFTNVWKQGIVKGFPSYRAMSSILYDPGHEKILLFGGTSSLSTRPSGERAL